VIFTKLRRRLLLTNVAVMTAILAALAGGALLVMDRLLVAQETSTVEADLQHAATERNDLSKDEFQSRHNSYTSGTFYIVWDSTGSVTFNPSGAPTAPLAAAAAQARAGRQSTVEVNLQSNQPALVSSRLLTGDSSHVTEVLQAARSLAPVRSVEREALLVLLGAGMIGLLIIVLAGWFLTERALGPIRSAMNRQVQFTADASHELRTPLTIIDAGLQVLRRHPRQTIGTNEQVLDSISGETRRMTRLVDDLLTLARVDSGQAPLYLQRLDVSALINSTAGDLRALGTASGGHVTVTVEPSMEASVDSDRLRQVLVILVDNALRHGQPGGAVEVRASRARSELRLEVTDQGPGIPAEQRDQVFERFHRLEGGRSATGAGLGLSIALWIVRSHRGSIKLLDNNPGLRVQVTLPVAEPSIRKTGGPVDQSAGLQATDGTPDTASTT
jgi:two-component system, OmpR family, sensor histidine kinase CiaH